MAELLPDQLDVCIVGCGPVGLILALCLQHSLKDTDIKIGIVERQAGLYPLPRAVCLDHETLRLLHALGLGEVVDAVITPWTFFSWRDAKKEVIVDLPWFQATSSGHHNASGFSQPELEGVLHDAALSRGIKISRSWALHSSLEKEDYICATFIPWSLATAATAAGEAVVGSKSMKVKYLVGCDGANSTVRRLAGIEMHDLGFKSDWLIADIVPPTPLPTLLTDPGPMQFCDPARPTTIVHAGPGRERLEFMKLPNETIEELREPSKVWELLGQWGLFEDTCKVERIAVYTFHARWATTFNKGRYILAGDAAHLMPPFIGQGMNSGCRDAVALAWRLESIVKGLSSSALLDSYTTERLGHVQQVTGLAVMLGKAICVTSEEEAALLHAHIRSGPPPPSTFRLGESNLFNASQPGSGFLGFQRKVNNSKGTPEWFDLVHERGWMLLSTVADPFESLSDETKSTFVNKMLGKSVWLKNGEDIDGNYSTWLKTLGGDVVLVRPDFFLAFSSTLDELEQNLKNYLPGVCLN